MKLVKRKGINRFDIKENDKVIGYSTYSERIGMSMIKISFNDRKLKDDLKLRRKTQIAIRMAINEDKNEIEIS